MGGSFRIHEEPLPLYPYEKAAAKRSRSELPFSLPIMYFPYCLREESNLHLLQVSRFLNLPIPYHLACSPALRMSVPLYT